MNIYFVGKIVFHTKLALKSKSVSFLKHSCLVQYQMKYQTDHFA
jgi:hypothetical protein